MCLRGSGWLTARRPGPTTTIGKLNRGEKLALYNLAVIEREHARIHDPNTLEFLKGLSSFPALSALGPLLEGKIQQLKTLAAVD